MTIPTEADLASAIEEATRGAVADLFKEHPGHYYYLTLATTGDASAPILSAWSEEALHEAVKAARYKDRARRNLKWNYADSPFCNYGQEYFGHVQELFLRRPDIHSFRAEDWSREYDLRLRAMEQAIARLNHEGLFGKGEERNRIVVIVEVMPPDHTNVERAYRLNPPEALRQWIEEAAEIE